MDRGRRAHRFFLTYRLIEPSYELYRQLGLYERNLTNFDEHPIYENNDTSRRRTTTV